MQYSEELKADCAIDPAQLDVECTRQPELVIKWAERAIRAKSKVEVLEFRAKTLEGRLQLECREHPEEFGLNKKKAITEPGIKAAVASSDQYTKFMTEYFSERKKAMFLDKAVGAIEGKGSMLKQLVLLHGQQYFAGPDVPHDLVSAYAAHRKRENNAANDRQGQFVRKRVKRHD